MTVFVMKGFRNAKIVICHQMWQSKYGAVYPLRDVVVLTACHVPSTVLFDQNRLWNHGLQNLVGKIEDIEDLPEDYVEKNWKNENFMHFFFHVVTAMSHTPLEGRQLVIKNEENPLPLCTASDFAFPVLKWLDNKAV